MGGQTGSCTWEYDPSTKTLTISGEGGMENYAPALSETTLTTSPWDKVRREIEHVVIEEGVTGIGDYAFTGINFGDAWITTPQTTKRIGVGAFSSCGTMAGIDVKGNSCTIEKEAFAGVGYQKALEKISLSGVKYISEGAFQNTDSREVVFDGGIKEIGKSAFAYNKAVTEMELPESCTYLANAALEGCEKLAKLTIYNRECLIVKSANVIPEGTAIYGYRGSTAEEYAKSYGREFHAIGVFSFDEATWTL
ncbi:MAG: leucine-rich repeat domain-containing protein, partial [bacterium]